MISTRIALGVRPKAAIKLNLLSPIRNARYNSNNTSYSHVNLSETHPVYLVAVPITSKKVFLYCKYSTNALPLNGSSQSLITKFTDKATTAWNKFSNSKNKVNVTIMSSVNSLLEKIPWEEKSLRSVPSKGTIGRFLKTEYHDEHKDIIDRFTISDKAKEGETQSAKPSIPQDIIEKTNFTSDHLEEIPIFYPSELISRTRLINHLRTETLSRRAYHMKYLIRSLILLPVTLPVALIPLIPNVPGFYVAYRAWCHFTAIRGVDHLKYLLGTGTGSESHLDFIGLPDIGDVYLNVTDQGLKQDIKDYIQDTRDNNKESHERGKLLINEESLSNLCKVFQIEEAEDILKVALHQEKASIAVVESGK